MLSDIIKIKVKLMFFILILICFSKKLINSKKTITKITSQKPYKLYCQNDIFNIYHKKQNIYLFKINKHKYFKISHKISIQIKILEPF